MSRDWFKASKEGNVERFRELLAADKTLLHLADAEGSTALHYACWKGHLALVEELIASGADVMARNSNDHWGTTPLHAAAHANHHRIVELLLSKGADATAVDGNGKTPLDHTEFHAAKAAAKVLRLHSEQ